MKKVFILFCLVLVSCSNNQKNGDDIMTVEEMVDFLFDVNLINTSRGFTNISKNNYFLIRDSMLFKKHEIDCLKFVKSNNFYSRNPKLYLEIYEGIDVKINTIIDSINNIKE
tara:strand:+ start:1492 stop:1827 length:336 start_codon:yes stop_codon:yes gene_type:complete